MFEKVKINYTVIIIALICGLIFSSHHFLTQILLDDDPYTPLVAGDVNFYTIEETMYASNIRDVYDGHLIVTDSQIYENKDKFNMMTPWFTYLVLGLMTKLTGSIVNTFIISDFLLPTLTFLLVYFIVNKATQNHLLSILAGVGVLFISYAFALQSPEFYLQNLVPFNFGRLPYYLGRLPFTEFTVLPFLSTILSIYLSLETGKKHFILLAGILGGLQFYTYIFNAFGVAVGMLLLFLFFLIRKDFRNMKITLIIGLAALIIGLPYIAENINAALSSDNAEFLSKVGVYYGRLNPLFLLRTLFYGIFILPYFLMKNKKLIYTIILLFYSTGIIGLNLQLVLGYTIQPTHYWFVILEPLGIILLSIYFFEIFYKNNIIKFISMNYVNKLGNIVKHKFKPILSILIIGLLFHGALMHISYALVTYKSFTLTQSQRELFQWLNDNTVQDEVVMTLSIENNILLPVYTHNNVFLPNALNSMTPLNETVERLLISYKLIGVPSSYLEWLLENEYINTSIRGHISIKPENYDKSMFHYYLFHYRHMIDIKKLMFDTKLPREVILEEIQTKGLDVNSIESIIFVPNDFRSNALLKFSNYTDDIYELVNKYKMDYIIIGAYEKSIIKKDFDQSGLIALWSNNDYTVYNIPN